MSGSKIFVLAWALLLLVGCEKRDEDKLQEQELIQMIDKQRYHEVIKWFENNPDARQVESFKIYKAYAYMGMGSLEPLKFVADFKGVQTFSDNTLQSFFRSCPNGELDKNFKEANRCLSVRLMNQVPDPNNLYLRKAREVFREMRAQGRLSKQDKILMGFVEICFVLARVKNVLLSYAKLDPEEITHEQAKELFDEVQRAGRDMEMFVGTLKAEESILTEKLTGIRGLKLFRDDLDGKIAFAESTGFPLFWKVTDMNDESGISLIGRNAIIQVLDQGLEFFDQ